MPRLVKKRAMKPNAVPRMTADKKRLAREMHFDRGLPRVEVAKALGRELSTIVRQLAKKSAAKPIRRPKALSAGLPKIHEFGLA